MTEKRTHNRLAVALEVKLEGASGVYHARTSDISPTGCYIDSIAPVMVGEVVRFKVKLPDGAWIDLRGEVVYQFSTMGFGLRFTEMNEEIITKLEALKRTEQ